LFHVPEELSKINLNLEEEVFIVELVTELGRTFLAATDTNTQTCASYAMQVGFCNYRKVYILL